MNTTIIKIVTKAVEAALPAIIDSVQNKLGKKQNLRSPNNTGTLDQQLSKIQAPCKFVRWYKTKAQNTCG